MSLTIAHNKRAMASSLWLNPLSVKSRKTNDKLCETATVRCSAETKARKKTPSGVKELKLCPSSDLEAQRLMFAVCILFLIVGFSDLNSIRSVECNPLNGAGQPHLPQQVINKVFRHQIDIARQRRHKSQQLQIIKPSSLEATSMAQANVSIQALQPHRSKQRRTIPQVSDNQPKRFKSNDHQLVRSARSNSSVETNATLSSHPASIGSDINNNSATTVSPTNDVNNNTIANLDNEFNSIDGASQSQRALPVVSSSVNGTIDLSQYGQSDVDRLYGDALLVYLKNFNETLPSRRELISVNGTQGQVPMYRSERKSNL